MSLIRFLKAPMNLFKKDVISFVIIRRHDIIENDNKLRYISVKPSASIGTLRRKIWHLLDLPDYCDELIILKCDDVEISMSELRKGNDPQKPYILEVWPAPRISSTCITYNNMITMGAANSRESSTAAETTLDEENHNFGSDRVAEDAISCTTFSRVDNESTHSNTLNVPDVQGTNKLVLSGRKKSELSNKISNSSLFFKLHGKKSRDNFVSILLKIQSDLCMLTNKLSVLENKVSR